MFIMRKILLTILFITSLFGIDDEINTKLIFGINFSTYDYNFLYKKEPEKLVNNLKYLNGLKVGFEKNNDNNFLWGFTYSQKGYKMYIDGTYSIITGYEFHNYLSSYLIKPFLNLDKIFFIDEFDLSIGFEINYFLNGKTEGIYINKSNNYYTHSYSGNFSQKEWKDMEGEIIDYGILIGGRLLLDEKTSINVNYYYGLNDISSVSKLKNRSFQVYLSTKL